MSVLEALIVSMDHIVKSIQSVIYIYIYVCILICIFDNTISMSILGVSVVLEVNELFCLVILLDRLSMMI